MWFANGIEAWQTPYFFYNASVIGFIRFFGLLNAAIWLGGAISFTFAIGPAFFTDQMKAILPPPYNGAAAQMVIHRYFILLNCCGAIALLHFFWEKLYSGKTFERLALGTILFVIALSLSGGFWVQPKLRALHLQKYDARASSVVRAEADRSFKVWHGVSQTMNLFVIGGLLVYLWRVSNPPNSTRFSSSAKFRG